MTHEDAGHYAAKHSDKTVDPLIAQAIADKMKDDRITCAAAHAIARRLSRPPQLVGVNIDLMEKRIRRCQLGLFGYGLKKKKAVKAATMVAPTLRQAIRNAMSDDRITCRAAWDVAAQMKLTKLEVAAACEALQVKISRCQLGAF